jgi:hypothetical protein
MIGYLIKEVKYLKILVVTILSALLLTSCEKEYLSWSLPQKAELKASIVDVSSSVIKIKGEILSENSGVLDEIGFLITKGDDFSLAKKFLVELKNEDVYLFNLEDFEFSTSYQVRFFITNKAGISQSGTVEFVTPNISGSPSVKINGFTDLSLDNVRVNATVISDGGFSVADRGFCWSTSPNPTINNQRSNNGNGSGDFSYQINDLLLETTYYIRAYATNQTATSYSSQLQIKTKGISQLAWGDIFAGGLFFYIFQPGDIGYIQGEIHGLVAAPSDQGDFAWGCSGTSVSTSDKLGSGFGNTVNIVNNCGQANIAATVCNNLSVNGYNDWYLPSSMELQKMRTNLHKSNAGGFKNGLYWSSHQFSPTTGAAINFNLSGTDIRNEAKSNLYFVRAIRKF